MARRSRAKAAVEGEPNIQFVGKGGLTPFKSISNGMDTIELPTDQSEAFYHPQAALIRRLYPKYYKEPVKKGAKK